MKRITLFVILFALTTAALAQELLQPVTWFTDADAILAVGAMFAGYIVNLLTAIGKDWLKTDGPRTRYLAIGLSAVIAGAGGYLSLGMFGEYSGWEGAARAAVMIVITAVAAIGKAEADRQAAASGAKRAGKVLEG